MRLVYFCSDQFGVAPLHMLVERGFIPSLVVTHSDTSAGRGMKVKVSLIAEEANRLGLNVYKSKDIASSNTKEKLKAQSPDLFIVLSFGQILPKEVLGIPKDYSINVHPSLLPKYRGPAPVNWALIKGEKHTGVTIFRMDETIDGGDIILQKRVNIMSEDDAISLKSKLSFVAAGLLLEAIEDTSKGKVNFKPQSDRYASYARKLNKKDGLIDFKEKAQDIRNRIRGCMGWPGAYTFYKGKRWRILEADVLNQAHKAAIGQIIEASKFGIKIQTGKGQLLITSLQPESKKPMRVEEFLKGHSVQPEYILKQSK